MAVDEIGTAFVRLGLSIGRHVPGYVDSYYGPDAIAQAVEAEGEVPLPRLEALADRLAAEVAADPAIEPARREYLLGEIAAMHTTLRLLQGDSPGIIEEVRRRHTRLGRREQVRRRARPPRRDPSRCRPACGASTGVP
jgi:hypothetical protein